MIYRNPRCLVLLLLALMLIFGSTVPNISADEVFVGFQKLPGRAEEALVRAFGGKIKYTYRIIPAIAVDLPAPAIAQLRANPMVTQIVPNSKVYALDAELDNSWGVKRIGAGTVHAAGNRGAGVKVAVIDTGIDYNHLELDGNYVCGYDFVNGDNDPMDDHGHGTHVAGIIAAEDDNAGVVGVAPEVELYGLKALGNDGVGNMFDIIAAMEWATGGADPSKYPNGNPVKTDIINMSLGANVGNIWLEVACFLAYNQDGLLVFAAAGNDGNPEGTGSTVDYPAAYSSVVAVAATDQNDERAIWPQPDPEPDKASGTGPQVELCAPGDLVYSAIPGGGYTYHSGTSMACPHAAGTAALVWASEPNLTNEGVRARLQQTADDLGDPGRDNWYGYGIIDALEAVSPAGPPNNAPVAADDPYSIDEDITLTVLAPGVLANDLDVDGDSLSAILDSDVSNGTLTLNADGSFIYTPNANYNGTDSFTYTANDGIADSNTATVTVIVQPVNDDPVAVDDMATTPEGTSIDIDVLSNDVDVDGNPLVVASVTQPTNGTATIVNNDQAVKYTPNANYNGPDSFTYTANDGSADSNIATVTITVNPSVLTAYVSIEMGQQPHKKKAWWKASATVRITSDGEGEYPIVGAEISGHWSGAYTGSASGVSDTNGVCVFQTGWIKGSGAVTFTVDTVTKDGQDYLPQENTSDPIGGPASTATVILAQNHPNPFNPETWIPYGLFKTEHVVIRICDSAGRIVRILNLGQKAPGIYMSKEKAAYWDGKNEAGEQVSSGVYFYTIQAGDFTATRKMVVAE